MPDELRSAYAVLGLQPGASLQKVKQQFKTLVRRWHPDRFANDPQGKVEANDRLRVINNAYDMILQTSFGEASPQVRRDPPPAAKANDRPASARSNGSASTFADEVPREPKPPPVRPLTRDQIDALIDALKGYRRRKSLREQIAEDPWNRGLSLAFVGLYMLVDAVQAWRHPWSMSAAGRFQPSIPGPGSVMASVVGSVLWTVPLLWVIWYADALSKKIAWLFLVVFALLLPLLVAMMRP